MFDQIIRQALERWAGRLRNVRAELVSISVDLETLAQKPEDLGDNPEALEIKLHNLQMRIAIMATSVRALCGILVRVLDALKGAN